MLASIAEREQSRHCQMSWSFGQNQNEMITIENNQECFVMLWQKLERTRRLLGGQCKRYCIRNVLKSWFGFEANDDELPEPSLFPRKHREFLRAIVAVKTGISYWRINLKALDAAYSIAFPKSTPININKKGKKVKK